MRSRALALALAPIVACAQSVVDPDALDGSTRADAGLTLDLDATPNVDATVDLDASGADARADASSADAASPDAAPPLQWRELLIPENTQTLYGVVGRSATEIYAVGSRGKLLRFDGASWSEIWRTPTNEELYDVALHGPTRLLLSGQQTLYEFDGVDARATLRATASYLHAALSTGPSSAYVATEDRMGGRVVEWTGSAFRDVYQPPNANAVYALHRESSGELFAGALYGNLVRISGPEVGPETIELPAHYDLQLRAAMAIRGIARVGDDLFAVANRHVVLQRGATGWRLIYENAGAPDQLYALAGGALTGGGVEAFAVGDAPRGGGVLRYDGTTWAPLGLTDRWVLRDIWRVGPDQYVAVGGLRSVLEGLIVRASR